MLVGHVYDFAVVLRSRRRELRLRQDDLARHAGVSRGFISDLEHGKSSVEFGKVLKVMAAMNVPMSIGWKEEPPDWTKPIIKRARARERGWAEDRPRSWRRKLRPAPKPPPDWYQQEAVRAETRAWLAQRKQEWTKAQVDRFAEDHMARQELERAEKARAAREASELRQARWRIVRALALRDRDP